MVYSQYGLFLYHLYVHRHRVHLFVSQILTSMSSKQCSQKWWKKYSCHLIYIFISSRSYSGHKMQSSHKIEGEHGLLKTSMSMLPNAFKFQSYWWFHISFFLRLYIQTPPWWKCLILSHTLYMAWFPNVSIEIYFPPYFPQFIIVTDSSHVLTFTFTLSLKPYCKRIWVQILYSLFFLNLPTIFLILRTIPFRLDVLFSIQ